MSADLSEEVEPTALANLQCIDWVRKRISLAGFEASMWKEDHQVVVSDFLATNAHNELKKLIAYMSPAGELCIQYTLPQDKATPVAGELMYFLRDPTREVRARPDARAPPSTRARTTASGPCSRAPKLILSSVLTAAGRTDQHGNH
jgi:hypothetical protein